MALALRGSVVSAADAVSPFSLAAPTGLAANDIVVESTYSLFATTFTTGGLGALGTQSADSNGYNPHMGQKVATGSETTFDCTFGGGHAMGLVFAVSGGDTTTPYESYTQTNQSNLATYVAAAATPTRDNCWHVVGYQDGNSSANTVVTPPAGYTLLAFNNGGVPGSTAWYFKDLGAGSSGVSTGTKSLVWAANGFGAAHSFIVRSAAAAAGTSGLTKLLMGLSLAI